MYSNLGSETALVEGSWEIADEVGESRDDLGEIEARLDDQISVISELVSSGEAGTDVDWASLALWFWDAALVAKWADASKDLLKVSTDSIVSLLSLNVINEGLEEWNHLGDTADAAEDVGDGEVFKGSFIEAFEESDFFFGGAGEGVEEASGVEFLACTSEVVDEVDEGFRVVHLVGQRSEHSGNGVNALQASLGAVGLENGDISALLEDGLGSRDEGFNVLFKTNPVTILEVGVERLNLWDDAEKAELAHVLGRSNSQGEEKGNNSFVHCSNSDFLETDYKFIRTKCSNNLSAF